MKSTFWDASHTLLASLDVFDPLMVFGLQGAFTDYAICRPQSDQILRIHGMVPTDKEINGIFFCIFSPLSTSTSRGTASALMDVVEKLVPFENIDMGPIIGKGSFGSVFKAANKERIVAIKVGLSWIDCNPAICRPTA